MVSTTALACIQDRLEKLSQMSTPIQSKAPVKSYHPKTFLLHCWQ